MNIQIIDNAINDELRKEVWDYIATLPWFTKFKLDNTLCEFTPSTDGYETVYNDPRATHGITMARTALAADRHMLKAKHKPIYELWSAINSSLDNKYDISGYPEGVPQDSLPEWQAKTAVPGLSHGWRVYTNGQYNENIKHSHGIHRDTPNLNDDTSVTILYVANLEWYPSWFGEVVYYDDKVDSGDHQQFQVGDAEAQRRNFSLGWAQQIVSPVPGRITVHDGRQLHTTRPTAIWSKTPRVTLAFRARLK